MSAREDGDFSAVGRLVSFNVGLENISNTVILALLRDMT